MTITIKQSGEYWVGWIEEIPGVNVQEKTRHEVIGSLRLVLLELFNINVEEL